MDDGLEGSPHSRERGELGLYDTHPTTAAMSRGTKLFVDGGFAQV